MQRLRDWWHQRIFWRRFTRGVCTRCGVGKPMLGATYCPSCFEKIMESR
jgi:ribosomal protein L40E